MIIVQYDYDYSSYVHHSEVKVSINLVNYKIVLELKHYLNLSILLSFLLIELNYLINQKDDNQNRNHSNNSLNNHVRIQIDKVQLIVEFEFLSQITRRFALP